MEARLGTPVFGGTGSLTPSARSVKRAAADLLRNRLPGLHAALRKASGRTR